MHVVTGASTGIGRAVAAALGARGESVLAVARSGDPLRSLASGHPSVRPLVADLSTVDGRSAVVAAVPGAVASLVHGAGSKVAVGPLIETDPDALLADMAVHVAAVLALNQAFADRLERIVVFDSYSATTPRVGWAAYSIVKAAAQMLAVTTDAEFEHTVVLRMFPGGVRTPLLETLLASGPSPARDAFRALGAEGRLASPTEIGEWVADHVTGPVPESRIISYDDVRPPGPSGVVPPGR